MNLPLTGMEKDNEENMFVGKNQELCCQSAGWERLIGPQSWGVREHSVPRGVLQTSRRLPAPPAVGGGATMSTEAAKASLLTRTL